MLPRRYTEILRKRKILFEQCGVIKDPLCSYRFSFNDFACFLSRKLIFLQKTNSILLYNFQGKTLML